MAGVVAARLRDMIEAVAELRRVAEGKSFQDYEKDWLLRRAAERAIEIISEASRRLPRELKERHPYPRWHEIAGIGNVLRHEYHRVDDRIVWTVIQDELPRLQPHLERMLDEVTSGRELR